MKSLLRPAPRTGDYGLLAEFDSPRSLHRACGLVRDAGYTHWDAHTPFPIHGLERAMGLRDSRLGWVVLVQKLWLAYSVILMQ